MNPRSFPVRFLRCEPVARDAWLIPLRPALGRPYGDDDDLKVGNPFRIRAGDGDLLDRIVEAYCSAR